MTDTILSRFSAYQIPLHGVRLPSFVIPQEDRDKLKLDSNASNFEFLRSLCLAGFKKLKLKKDSPEYKAYAERANYELTTLNELGFVDYILLVWVVLNFCKKKGIPTGLGRGSAAGSLVLFLIGVTGIDPIKYGLYFERFISKTRAKKKVVDGITYLDGSLMCDVDIDICYYRRNEVLEYLNTLFAGKVSKILTLNTLSGKLLIKECGKIISNKSETEMNSVAALIPKIFGNVEDIEVAYKDVKEFQEWCDENREVYEVALSLRDLIKNKSVHASGVMLSYDDLSKSCPVEKTTNDEYVSGYDMKWASLMNVKLDCLGLRAVSVVADACKSIGITMVDINVNDPLIYQNLYDLKCPHGIFQIEAHTAFKSLQKIKPKNIEELSAVLAIARPGALQFLDEYANYTNNGTCKTVHPFFDDIFGKTGGQCLYQEQLIAAIRKIGFSAEEGELVRRCVGKKDHKGMAEWEVKIKQKVIDNKLDPQIFDIVWKIAQDSASYSFNASHSFSYAALSAITTYLKFKYPQQFFLSLLNMAKNEPDPRSEISKIEQELPHFDIKLLPPCIIKSSMDFTIEKNDIRFGLCLIKGISDKAIAKILEFRNFKDEYKNKFEIFHAAEECGISMSVLCPLIQAGAFEDYRQDRSLIVLEAQLWNILTEKEKRHAIEVGPQYNFNLILIVKSLLTKVDEKGNVVIKESRYNTIKTKYEPYKDIYKINSANESFANWYYERQLMGYSCSSSLRDVLIDKYKYLRPIGEIIDSHDGHEVRGVGTVVEHSSGVSKAKGTKWFRMNVSDETGQISVLIFNDRIEEIKSINNDKMPTDDNIVYFSGVRKGDAVFANMCYVEDSKIYVKLGDLKRGQEEKQQEENKKIVDEIPKLT